MEVIPVKYEDYFNDEFGLDVSSAARKKNVKVKTENFPIPEDLWSKFESSVESESDELFRTTYFDDFINELTFDNIMDTLFAQVESFEEQTAFSGITMEKSDDVLLHNHDCMWAGHCGSSEHPVEELEINGDEDKSDVKNPLTLMAGAQYNAPVSGKGAGVVPQQQSLLKPSLRSAGLPIINMITPQTPPMSDDEDKHHIKQTPVLKIFPTPEEDDDAADQDLCEYFGGKLDDEMLQNEETTSASSSSESSESEDDDDDENDDDDDEEPQPSTSATSYNNLPNVTSIRSNIYATENDHSYHKDKNASMRMASLGIDTPSDSEEEIDVVSVSDKKYTAASRMSYALPTNPSISDRCHLQRTMETAMHRRRRSNNPNPTTTNGLKIMLPTKRQATSTPSCTPPAKRKTTETNRGGSYRRTKQYRMTTKQTSSYRRRTNYNHDSESEPEPSEKRSLHNNMERQRRIDLRNAFEYLRQLVPEVLKKDRAAKVVILREAAKYCDNLTNQSMNLSKQADDLKRYQERLRMRVSMLRRNLALKR